MSDRVAEQWRLASVALVALASIPLLMTTMGSASTSAVETTPTSIVIVDGVIGEQAAGPSTTELSTTELQGADAVTVTSMVNRSEAWTEARSQAGPTGATALQGNRLSDGEGPPPATSADNLVGGAAATTTTDTPPTTAAPTTTRPSTSTSTTATPTTAPPTTATPTTPPPTTAPATTAPPATAPPATAPPTTVTPTTAAPAQELPPPPSGGDPTAEQWAELRSCESSGRYDAVNPTGQYRGAYQFGQATWDGLAAQFFPHLVGIDPAAASVGNQDLMALALWRTRGSQPWPHCGSHLVS